MDILYFPVVSVFVFSVMVVLESSAQTQPVLEKSEIHINITAGRTAILPCMVTGLTESNNNRLQIVWQSPKRRTISYGTQRITSDKRFRVVRPYDPDWNLNIRNVEPSDHGEYRCQLNTQPVQQKKVFLHVQVPPDITASTDTEVPEGETLVLYCNVTGQPKPSVTWYKDGIMLQRGKEILEVRDISRNQAGIYRCRATNSIEPSALEEIVVNVLYQPEVESMTNRLGQYRGKEAILECRVRANPYRDVSWNRNGKKLPEKPWKYKIEVFNVNGESDTQIMQLRIMMLEKTDFGRYHCKAKNSLGSDSDVAVLTELTTRAPTTSTVTISSTSSSTISVTRPQSISTISSTMSSKKPTNGNPSTFQVVTNKYYETTNHYSETAEKYGSSESGDKNVIEIKKKEALNTGTSQFSQSLHKHTFTVLIPFLIQCYLNT